ncbi:MAG: hypothetical protein Q7S58_08235 [Candidatus Binatus sp.]|uniref:hypothetical protein n=1 Tax=Candidatus Binatus sp. TaxID=2811406 RepID=UPI002717C9AE|nr:hypothetical protein [Candidatus Binatus sp.]MDO8432379.1 hypothetical protein [Candidatus Binatus sp.]
MRILSWLTRTIAAGLLVLELSATLAYGQAVCDQQARFNRPILLGTSGGNIKSFQRNKKKIYCFGGTLGSLVQDSAGQYILSNNHVLARTNRAKAGESIVQPGLIETQCKAVGGNRVATLSRTVKLTFSRVRQNTVDAAIARISAGDVDADIRNIGAIANSTAAAAPGLEVQKMGRTTCLTLGMVSAVAVNATVGYDDFHPERKHANFVNQILITGMNFSAAGDSGSLIVTQDPCPQAVGLLFAGSADGSSTLANPIGNVLRAFSVKMVGSCVAPAASASAATELAQSGNVGVTSEAVASAAAIRTNRNAELMRIPGAVGTGIAIGDRAGQAAIEVYVTKLTPEIQAAAPTSLDGVTVRLIETHGFVAY